ncbi:TonB-dependent siderophore receptor [Parashewanella tropica]|uniref:TonB-dependent siderophore receptor n=1 Tax=Parashewanella tropica TaxID=2547970 RepID=UPI00147917E7|nr:TonB-dependent receptor [Parashewanella tropica]
MSKRKASKLNQAAMLNSALISTLAVTSPMVLADDAQSNKAKEDIERIEVHGHRPNQLHIKDNTATKMNVDLKDVGRSITVLDAVDLDKRAIEDVKEAFGYVAGVRANGPADRTYTARGIRTSIDMVMIDGMRSLQGGEGGTGSRSPSTFNAEQVVFLRGPEALLYGAGIGGGIINIITKKPQEIAQTSISVKNRSYVSGDTGNFKQNRTSLDLDTTGAIDNDNTYLYRLLAQYTPSGDHFQKGRKTDEKQVDLSFIWNLSPSTTLMPRFEYANRELTGGSSYADGVFTENFSKGEFKRYGKPINRGKYYGSKNDKGKNLTKSYGLRLDHDFNSDWSALAQYRYSTTESEALDLYISDSKGLDNEIGKDKVNRKWVFTKGDDKYRLFDANIQGFANLMGMEHHILLGYNFRDADVLFERNFQSSDDAKGKNWISASNPDNQIVGPVPASILEVKFAPRAQKDTNAYLKDRIKVTSKTTVIAGLGYVEQKQKETRGDKVYSKTYNDFIWDFGVVQALTDDINVFATYSRAYQPVNARWIAQYGQGKTDYLAVEGYNYEVGMKADLLNGDLATSLTLYRMDRENSTKFVRTSKGYKLEQLSGKSFQSKGADLEVIYHFNDHFNTNFNYAFNRAYDTIGDNKGKQANNAPKHSASIWNNFKVNEELSFGMGLKYNSERFDGKYILPSYVEMDLGAFYKMSNWDFSMTLTNALDKNRAEGGANWVTVQPNAPRALNMKVKYTF